MLAYVSPQSLEMTLETGELHFHSRSRDELWKKGETSGNFMHLRQLRYDCDGDALVALVDPPAPPATPASAPASTARCWARPRPARTRRRPPASRSRSTTKRSPRWSGRCAAAPSSAPSGSYTVTLLDDPPQIGEKVEEEAEEVVRAAREESDERVAEEAADLLYHLSVLLVSRGVSQAEVMEVLNARQRLSSELTPRAEPRARRASWPARATSSRSAPASSTTARRRSRPSSSCAPASRRGRPASCSSRPSRARSAATRSSACGRGRCCAGATARLDEWSGEEAAAGAAPSRSDPAPDPYAAVAARLGELHPGAGRGPAAVRRRRRRLLRLRPGPHGRAARRAQPRPARPARHGADGHRRDARLRPPAPRADDPRLRLRRRRGRDRRRLRARRGDDRRDARAPARRRAGRRQRRASPSRREFVSNMEREEFEAAVARIVEYVHAGDAFQVVPSQRFSAPAPVEAFSVYRGLRAVNPSPYMYFLEFGDFQIAGASPEPLVKVEGGRVETRPIAGTSPRGRSEDEDRRLAERLINDPKERAEHVMLVDLGRNDLGRVCEYGSVKVDELMVVETYSHVLHIVSQVSGPAARGGQRDGRAALGAAGRHALRRAEGAGDADHRRARAGQALLLRRRDRLPLLGRRPRHRDPHPHRRRQGRPAARAGRRRHRRRRQADYE